MSRRDVIIIAVLLNAGLLAILFMMAINIEEDPLMDPSGTQQIVSIENRNSKEEQTHIALSTESEIDEIDAVLKDFAAAHSFSEEEPETVENEPFLQPEPLKTNEIAASVDVTVKRGDALEKIARANGTTVEAIKKANHLTSERLDIGQVLKVPLTGKKNREIPISENKPVQGSPAVNQVNQEFYTVQNGDNPWKIAKQFHIKLEDLLRLNKLDEEKARNLKPGEKIRVR